MFTSKSITATVIGTVTRERTFTVAYQGAHDTLFELDREDITGIARDSGLLNM